MNQGGINDDTRREVMRLFLRAFNGDVELAVDELRRYSGTISSTDTPALQAPRTKVSRDFSEKPIVLKTEELTKTYKRGKQVLTVLQNVNLAVHEGEFIAITGASGSGKSTLLQLLGGLDKPTSGNVFVGEKSIAKLSDGQLSAFRRETIGFVFQFFYLQPFLRLKQNLEVPGMFKRTKRRLRRARIQELAEKVGLADRLNHFPRELSGGQMQRAAIARALLNNPKVLLADEPTGNLDSQNSEQIIQLFEKIRDELGMTVIIVTHDRSIAERADRIITMTDGSIS